jgi:hypothetical protein
VQGRGIGQHAGQIKELSVSARVRCVHAWAF